LKHCHKFITNSSSSYYEAPFFLKPEQIVKIGLRNQNRNSTGGMEKKYATKKIIKEIRKLDTTKVSRKQTKQVPLDSAPQEGIETGQTN
jgi:UDP-N-acetylglucosamine 2-epimerase